MGIRANISMGTQSQGFTIYICMYLYRQSCGVIMVISGRRGLASESAESRVTSLESCDTCPFRPTVATINLTIVKGRLIHATLLSIRYPLSRKRMDSRDFQPDPQQASLSQLQLVSFILSDAIRYNR